MDPKADLRRSIRGLVAAMKPEERSRQSRRICRQLAPILQESPALIAGFMPLPDEPDIRPFLAELLKHSFRLCLPVTNGSTITFRECSRLNNLKPAKEYGIMEPQESSPQVTEESIKIVLVPGIAFSANGERLGRGKGCYDRWISKQKMANRDTKYIGICFDCQVVRRLPTSPHDQRMDAAVTAAETYVRQTN